MSSQLKNLPPYYLQENVVSFPLYVAFVEQLVREYLEAHLEAEDIRIIIDTANDNGGHPLTISQELMEEFSETLELLESLNDHDDE